MTGTTKRPHGNFKRPKKESRYRNRLLVLANNGRNPNEGISLLIIFLLPRMSTAPTPTGTFVRLVILQIRVYMANLIGTQRESENLKHARCYTPTFKQRKSTKRTKTKNRNSEEKSDVFFGSVTNQNFSHHHTSHSITSDLSK